jgi:hypothetical protein
MYVKKHEKRIQEIQKVNKNKNKREKIKIQKIKIQNKITKTNNK